MAKKKAEKKSEQIKLTFQSRIEMVPMAELSPDPKNERLIKRKDFDRLVTSLQSNPNMLMLRPIVYRIIKKKKQIVAGDKRYRGWESLGQEKIPAINATQLTEKELAHFHAWDNESVGLWDWPELEKWGDTFGIALPDKKDNHKFNDSNAEMPIVPKFDEKYYAVLIVVEAEMDFANLCSTLDLGKERDYKNTEVAQTQVISFDNFMKKLKVWQKK